MSAASRHTLVSGCLLMILCASPLFAQDAARESEAESGPNPAPETALILPASAVSDDRGDAAPGVAPEAAVSRARELAKSPATGTAIKTPAAMPELFSVGYLAQVLGSLLVVFLCLFAVIFLMRRFNRMGPSGAVPLRVLGSASVGHRERVVLIEAGKEQLLIGVSPGSVRTLHVLPEPIVISKAAQAAPDFAAVLGAANSLGGRS